MNGFFESVAARARGEAPAIRPRLASRFENAGPEPLELSVETIAEPLASSPTAGPFETETSRPPGPVTARADSAPPPAAVSPLATRFDTPALAQPEPARAEARPEVPASAQAEGPAVRAFEPPGLAPRAPATRNDPPSSVTQSIAAPAPPKPEARPNANPSTPAPTQAAPLALATTRPAPHEPALRAPRAQAERRAAARAPVREETTVHVSIGHIEVRAAQPIPEIRRRDPPRSPVMSLEDYLKSRRGRR